MLTPYNHPMILRHSSSVESARISVSQNSIADLKCPGTKSPSLRSGALNGVGAVPLCNNVVMLKSPIGRIFRCSAMEVVPTSRSFPSPSRVYVRTRPVRRCRSVRNAPTAASSYYLNTRGINNIIVWDMEHDLILHDLFVCL